MKAFIQLKTLTRLGAAAAVATAAAGPALAQSASETTLKAVTVTSNLGQQGATSLDVVINGKGLSKQYTSGSTPFDSWVNSTTHLSWWAESWISSLTPTVPTLSFDLGAMTTINGLAWFGIHAPNTAFVNRIKVYADNDNNASNGSSGLLFDSGTFAMPAGSTVLNMLPNMFSFAAAQTRYVNIELAGAASTYAVGEVVFRQEGAIAAVPEPGTYALMFAGLGVVGFMARRRRSA